MFNSLNLLRKGIRFFTDKSIKKLPDTTFLVGPKHTYGDYEVSKSVEKT